MKEWVMIERGVCLQKWVWLPGKKSEVFQEIISVEQKWELKEGGELLPNSNGMYKIQHFYIHINNGRKKLLNNLTRAKVSLSSEIIIILPLFTVPSSVTIYVNVTFSCDYCKVAQGLHGKQLAFHYLLDLKEKTQKWSIPSGLSPWPSTQLKGVGSLLWTKRA